MNVRYEIHDLPLPRMVQELPDAPARLTIRGAFPSESLKFISVVGARSYTPYGRQTCEALIRGLRGYPVVIVSGLALGIDGIAHRAALDAGLPTVAVPGSGLDDRVLYPAAHRALARDILDAGGALVSEFDPLWRPRPESFPQRNRIMAGMSHAVLVVEAELKSGTLITARLAADYNRDVCAVPGPVHSVTSRGPHMLLKRGAALIETSDDIREVLHIEKRDAHQPSLRFDLSNDEQAMVDLLKEPMPRDALVVASGKSASEANIILTSLELKGILIEQLGKVRLL